MLPRHKSHFSLAFINNKCTTPSTGPQDFCLHCRQILLNGQKMPGWASVLKTFTSLKPSAAWPCVLRELAFEGSSGIFCALFWQGAPLYVARAAGWVLKWACHGPSVVSSAYYSAVSNPFAMALKRLSGEAGSKSFPPVLKGWQERSCLIFHPSFANLQPCCVDLVSCVVLKQLSVLLFLPPPHPAHLDGLVQNWDVELICGFTAGEERRSVSSPCSSGWWLFLSHGPSLSVSLWKLVKFCWQTGFSGWLPLRCFSWLGEARDFQECLQGKEVQRCLQEFWDAFLNIPPG